MQVRDTKGALPAVMLATFVPVNANILIGVTWLLSDHVHWDEAAD